MNRAGTSSGSQQQSAFLADALVKGATTTFIGDIRCNGLQLDLAAAPFAEELNFPHVTEVLTITQPTLSNRVGAKLSNPRAI
jgi:hypothetical protein